MHAHGPALFLWQLCQPGGGEGQLTTLEADQCQLRQKLCYTNQMQYVVLFVLFLCVLLFVISLYYDTASKQSYCPNCRRDDNPLSPDGFLF